MSDAELSKLVRLRMALKDRIDANSAQLKELISKDKETLERLEGKIHAKLLETNVESVKTEFGTVFFKLHESFKVEDKETVMEWIKAEDMWHVLPSQVSKPEMKAYMEEHGGAVPPGIKYSGFQQVNFRKPTKKVGE